MKTVILRLLSNTPPRIDASRCESSGSITIDRRNEDSDSDNDEQFSDSSSIVDDIHEDASYASSLSSESDRDKVGEFGDATENMGTTAENFFARGGTRWEIGDRNSSGSKKIKCNLNPAPGLTVYARQRLRDNPILDSFLLIFTNGKYYIQQLKL